MSDVDKFIKTHIEELKGVLLINAFLHLKV